MRLHPAISEEDARRWLREQLGDRISDVDEEVVEDIIAPFAKAMAVLSAVVIADDPAWTPG